MALTEVRQRRVQQDWWDKFWRDPSGKVVVYQHPNVWLIAWAVLTVLSIFINGTASTVIWWASEVVLAIWAVLEIWKGVNYFRRTLGVVVLLLVLIAAFHLG